MAVLPTPTHNDQLGTHYTLTSTHNGAAIPLGAADGFGFAGFNIGTVETGNGGSFVVKQRPIGSGWAEANLVSCVVYTTDSEDAIAAGTALADGGKIYQVYSDMLETFLIYTSSSGTMELDISKGKF